MIVYFLNWYLRNEFAFIKLHHELLSAHCAYISAHRFVAVGYSRSTAAPKCSPADTKARLSSSSCRGFVSRRCGIAAGKSCRPWMLRLNEPLPFELGWFGNSGALGAQKFRVASTPTYGKNFWIFKRFTYAPTYGKNFWIFSRFAYAPKKRHTEKPKIRHDRNAFTMRISAQSHQFSAIL